MSQIATVELIYVAHSGRQYRAKHKQVHVGWELEDLEQQAKSNLSLRDYAIEFTNDRGHKQFIMPTDLETIIVNVVAITDERWEEPDYEALQQKWGNQLKPYPEPTQKVEPVRSAPDPSRAAATGTALMTKPKLVAPNPVAPVTPDGETTQSIKITWPTAAKPQQRVVDWPAKDAEETQPIKVLQGDEEVDATAVIERIAAGGSVTPGS